MPFYGEYTRSQALVAHHILFHLVACQWRRVQSCCVSRDRLLARLS